MHYSPFSNLTELTRGASCRPATPVECASVRKTMHCFGPSVDSVKGTTRPRTPFVEVIAAISFAPLVETSFQNAAAHCNARNSRDCNYRQMRESAPDKIKTDLY